MAPDQNEIKTKLNLLGVDDEALMIWLDRFPLLEGERAKTNLHLIDEHLQDRNLLGKILTQALESADPDNALNFLERLLNVVAGDQLIAILNDSHRCRQLLTVLGGSPFLGGILCRKKNYFENLFVFNEIDSTCGATEMLADLRKAIPDSADFLELQMGLRCYKAEQILRIGSRDLCGLASLTEVMKELSGLAAACLQRAYELCGLQLQREYGQPWEGDGEEQVRIATMTILGMGKFGGDELNFSSDIDLIYCYSSTNGETTGGRRDEKISLHRYFVKLSELITKALHEVTKDGFVFRVDTGLRPDGNNGDLAVSINGAEAYYESWGQSWERAALIKARPVAGDIALGEELLHRLKPFIYRRYLDFGMIEDIKLMKQKINTSLSRKQEEEFNLKLGRGGIREIEFFIQTQQLVNAGTRPKLQQRNSLQMLQLLHEEELISEEDRQSLKDSYQFLRTVEHRIQIVQEQQTHSLPKNQRDRDVLARRCGFSGGEDFFAALEHQRQKVSSIFKDLFYSAEEEEQEVRPEVGFVFDRESDPDLVKDLLEEKGFTNPDAAYDSLLLLRDGEPDKRLTRRGRRCLEKLAPLLMGELLDSPNPDQALNNLESFLRAIRASSSFYSLLVENPAIVKLLVALFGSSQLLSRIFIQRPELLDTMVSRSCAVAAKDRSELRVDLGEQMALAEDYELQLDGLRRFRNEEFLRIALNDLDGQMPQGEGAKQLSLLAEVCLEQAYKMARHELAGRFGAPFPEGSGEKETAFAIIGMGKLGGLELNYHSDLDIIFIYEEEGETRPVAETSLERFKKISNREYFAKLAQRIITVLTLATREGTVYAIDTRLRPSGNQGPLVSSFSAFKLYHHESAQPWERQAMTKARVVCGPAEFSELLQDTIATLTFDRPLPDNLQSEIYRLRQRMEQESAQEGDDRFNIKTGRGGMVDVEFVTQYLQLLHAGKIKALRTQNTISLLECLVDHHILPKDDADVLISGYKFLRRLENKLRLLYDQSINELSAHNRGFRKAAYSLDYRGSEKKREQVFLGEYQDLTGKIRNLLDKYLKPKAVLDGGNLL
ncbi:bifunctional [glutamate--ammonia ligase]-adenylyl-L-tyrosine phosphorylase/[glutamate--ammonia-ligase] adenylyltransferase [uncultured Desulfuromusa sp.]|uniref:bifunctional [glutamate--ammonia ligase]-adenylyl-L-tyrosine phosphorylase/[glutamate--ammonia-ligase] adenylyltransferase n=1 Tax=uncultured Desulfuromusa sp. TaxID=219183 RepID=UPI002AA75D65|nr:bifunctional [glutamate--ammonia ligase]-adenylyl-L-tyrosine phosphorylase/[glutamate--ammonia-ligase] adenylyltransferase [uncultured Desulfuromusa sp.]